jgi:hypothetical protein
MGIALGYKQLLSIGCCLFIVSGLTARPPFQKQKDSGKEQAPKVGTVYLPPQYEEQLQRLVVHQMLLERLPKMLEAPRKSAAPSEWMQHWRWLLYALAAIGGSLGGLGGIWGASHVLTKKPSRSDSAKPRIERLGLGADGRGGVWLREVFPWEK